MYNIKKKKDKKANNDPQNTTQVLRKDRHFLQNDGQQLHQYQQNEQLFSCLSTYT
jgi:hypothetical protein